MSRAYKLGEKLGGKTLSEREQKSPQGEPDKMSGTKHQIQGDFRRREGKIGTGLRREGGVMVFRGLISRGNNKRYYKSEYTSEKTENTRS